MRLFYRLLKSLPFSPPVFDFGGEALNGNCSVGQLTTIGFHQQLLNGGSLRKRYVESGFLSKKISSSQIYIRSDGMYFMPTTSTLMIYVVSLHYR